MGGTRRSSLPAVSTGAKDPYDAATEAYDQEFSFAISEAGRKTLGEIEEALKKVEDGTYGMCDVCKKPINVERLDAVPQARMCISCQEIEEKNAV